MGKKAVKEDVIESEKVSPSPKSKDAQIFTYVGRGEDSPRVIEFMGMQKFVRGQATEVTDPVVLQKIINNPSFVQGEVDVETLHTNDEDAKAEAEAQRKRDEATNAAWKKKHNKE